jgi:hypothetical protein
MAVYYKINSKEITYRIIDREAVILNLNTGNYYSLNKTGTFAWMLLENKISIEDLAKRLAGEFGIDIKIAMRDTKLLLKDLILEKIVKQEK